MLRERILIDASLAGERVDTVLARTLGISRTRAAEIAAEGGIRLGGRALAKSARVELDTEIVVEYVEETPLAVVPNDVADLEIVFVDEHIAVVNKPAGVAAHPSVGWDGPDVLGVLAARHIALAEGGVAERQGIVHRLDVGTSGLMVLARSEYAYTMLKRAFRDRTVHKVYHALVQGRPDPLRGTIDAPIARHPGHQWRFAVVEGGRESVTHYDTLEAMRRATLVEIELETGRTHQIRVHMSALGHPCVGDELYGADPTLTALAGLRRQWLHAVELSFEHPATGETVTFSTDYPADLEAALERVRNAD